MSKKRLKSGEVINLGKLNAELDTKKTYALIRTDSMEVIRMTIPKGKQITEHDVEGEVTVQCLSGVVEFEVEDSARTLAEDDWLFLEKKVPHSLKAKEDTVLLLTILFTD